MFFQSVALKSIFTNVGSLKPYIWLGIPSIIGLIKLIIYLYFLRPEDYGNYALAILYGTFFAYLVAPGAVEAILKDLTIHYSNSETEISGRLSLLFSCSFLISISVLLFIFLSIFFLIPNFENYQSIILLIFSQAIGLSTFNVSTTFYRARGDFLLFGLISSLRLLALSGPIVFAVLQNDLDFETLIIQESMVLLIISIFICVLLFRPLRIDLKFFKWYVKKARLGFFVALGAMIKNGLLSGERTCAKIFLSSDKFGTYSQWMALLSLFITAGGIIAIPLQKKIIEMIHSGYLLQAKKILVSSQIFFVTISIFLGILFVLFSSITSLNLEIFYRLGNIEFLLLIIASSVIGMSFYDSFVLAADLGARYVRWIIVLTCPIFSAVYLVNIYAVEHWNIIDQVIFLLVLSITLSLSAYLSMSSLTKQRT